MWSCSGTDGHGSVERLWAALRGWAEGGWRAAAGRVAYDEQLAGLRRSCTARTARRPQRSIASPRTVGALVGWGVGRGAWGVGRGRGAAHCTLLTGAVTNPTASPGRKRHTFVAVEHCYKRVSSLCQGLQFNSSPLRLQPAHKKKCAWWVARARRAVGPVVGHPAQRVERVLEIGGELVLGGLRKSIWADFSPLFLLPRLAGCS